ncbi:MAG: histidine kinase dimerization/phospho-acceptor domain-containing protein [Nostoc sp.]|uniref:histidine kinase dimerization/phospho-acceptor domain-containing protein n=1 Tax=Nostoc sp. TaxID=1180 RepID=UPI002FFD0F72
METGRSLWQKFIRNFNIVNAETRESIESPIIKVLQDGIIINLAAETILITKDGGEIPIDDSAAPIKDDQNNITGAVLVFRDITERKRGIEACKKQIEQEQLVVQWEEINQLKNDFLNLVYHELRSLLSNIKLMIQTIQASPGIEETQRCLELMEGECDRELRLINDLLDLQRLESSSYPVMTPDSLLLQQWLPWVIEPFQIRVQEHQQTLQINLPSNLPPLFSDGISLELILVELIGQ